MTSPSAETETTAGSGLGSKVRRGFVWSAMSNGSLRLASVLSGVVLARILAPEDFGVFAIALMVQAILINLAELGLAADLVRHGDLPGRGPTITSVALISSGLLTVLAWLTAGPLAAAMGSPDAAPVIQVMALTLPMAALTAVPYAHLQREFQQARLFAIDSCNFTVGTTLTIVLAVDGVGPMSIALGRVAGQLVSTVLQFVLTGERLRLGWRPEVASSGIRFGLPLAMAGLLSWSLLNIDTVLVATLAGATSLGFYVLAFNISSWPSSVIGAAVRAVAFPAFAQRGLESGDPDVEGLARATGVVWAASLLVGVALAVLSEAVIRVVYGDRWLPSAVVLAGLGLFGALRVVFDLWVAYLTACGAAGTLVWLQVAWIVFLTPVMWAGIHVDGLRGAAWAHVVVAAAFMLPLHLAMLGRHRVPLSPLLRALAPATLAIIPAGAVGWLVSGAFDAAWLQLVVGGLAIAATYALLLGRWIAVAVRRSREVIPTGPAAAAATTSP